MTVVSCVFSYYKTFFQIWGKWVFAYLAVADTLDVVDNGLGSVASQNKVAVVRVHAKVLGHGLCGSKQALRNDHAAKDAARVGRLPRLFNRPEQVLLELFEAQLGLDRRDHGCV